MEPAVGVAPTSPRYEGGVLLLNYTGWRARLDSHQHMVALQATALLFRHAPERLAERTGVEPACPWGHRVSTAAAYRSPHLSGLEEGVGFEPTGPGEDPRAFQARTRCRPGRPFQNWRRRQESNLRPPKGLRFSGPLGKPSAITSVVPAGGVAPPSPPYERGVLLMNYAGRMVEPTAGVEPASHPYRGCGLPVVLHRHGGHGWSRTNTSSMSPRRSAVILRALVGLRRLARRCSRPPAGRDALFP